jgi:hypothetical protein
MTATTSGGTPLLRSPSRRGSRLLLSKDEARRLARDQATGAGAERTIDHRDLHGAVQDQTRDTMA